MSYEVETVDVLWQHGGTSGPTPLTVKYALVDGNTNGNNALVAAVTGKKILVLSLLLVAAGNVTCTLQSGAGGTAISGPYEFNGADQPKGVNLPYSPKGHFKTAAGALLNMALDAAVQVAGHIVYVEID
jgi:hypothetical protein